MKKSKKNTQLEKLRTLRPHVLYLDVIDDHIIQGEFPEIVYHLVRRKDNKFKSDLCVTVAFDRDLKHISYCVNSLSEDFLRKTAFDKATGRFIQTIERGDFVNGPEMFGDYLYKNLSEKVLTFLQREWKP